jgi:acetyl-CoA acetyltransferase
MSRMLKEAAIAGIGATEFSKNSGRSELQLAAECSLAACRDAGVDPADIDGMVTFTIDNNDEVSLARCLGAKNLAYSARMPWGGSGSVATLAQAVAWINAGMCKNVLIWRAMNERSEYRFGQNQTGATRPPPGVGATSLFWAMPYGAMTPASWVGLQFGAYMQRYGITNADLAHVAVQQRDYAVNNPAAGFYGKPITIEDHQNSRWVQAPLLRLLDCCQESDGGQAFLVTSVDRARDLKQPVVKIAGVGQAVPSNTEIVTNFYHDDLTTLPEVWGAAERLYAQTGMGPDDIQAAMLYDAFTPSVLVQLEGFGFCGRGEAADFVKSGALAINGRLPVNTHGGLLSEAYIHGMNSIAEGVRQVRGSSFNQVKSVQNVLVSSLSAAAILSRG